MKQITFLLIILLVLICFSCKTKKSGRNSYTNEGDVTGFVNGYVSHAYKSTECSPTVIVPIKNQDTLVLWPSNGLGEFDIEGIWIKFKYLPLRMATPEGCKKGIPASISEIKKL